MMTRLLLGFVSNANTTAPLYKKYRTCYEYPFIMA
jgi:hypothetical protein